MPIQKIAILGAGNGGCAAAADLTLRGFQVRLFARSESTIAKLAKLGEIELVESGVSKKAAPYFMSPHLPPVVQGVDLIVIATPAVGHEYLAKGLANYVGDGQRILLNPGHTGGSLHFANLLRQLGCKAQVQLCETVTLTYICRMPQPGRVEIYRRTTNLRCAALPGKHTAELVREIQSVFPNVIAAANVLETGFSNINAIMHPAGMLGNAGWIEKTGGDFLYYREGITPSIGAWIDALDEERLEIVRRARPYAASFRRYIPRCRTDDDRGARLGIGVSSDPRKRAEFHHQVAAVPGPSLHQGRCRLRFGADGGDRQAARH